MYIGWFNFNQYGVTTSDYKWHLYVISKCEEKKTLSFQITFRHQQIWIELSWAKGPRDHIVQF